MPMKQNLCAAISNPSGYTIVGESGRSNFAPKVAAQPPNEEATTTPREKYTRVGWWQPLRPTHYYKDPVSQT